MKTIRNILVLALAIQIIDWQEVKTFLDQMAIEYAWEFFMGTVYTNEFFEYLKSIL